MSKVTCQEIIAEMKKPKGGEFYYCKDCDESAPLVLYDESFNHHFGVETRLIWKTQCCDERVY